MIFLNFILKYVQDLYWFFSPCTRVMVWKFETYQFQWMWFHYKSIYIYIYIYIYISKSWSVAFIVATLQLSHINVHVIIFYLFNFLIIVFSIYLFLIFTLLQPFSLPYLFISPLPSTLISFTLFPFIFLYFCLFLFTPSNYKFVTISSILHIAIPHKNRLFLSLSLSQFFWWIFYFSYISALGW